jgi:hypothetical protein
MGVYNKTHCGCISSPILALFISSALVIAMFGSSSISRAFALFAAAHFSRHELAATRNLKDF